MGHYLPTMQRRMRALREAAGIRREDLASRANISFDYVRRLETSDDHIPTLEVARRIASVLGVTVDEVFPERAA